MKTKLQALVPAFAILLNHAQPAAAQLAALQAARAGSGRTAAPIPRLRAPAARWAAPRSAAAPGARLAASGPAPSRVLGRVLPAAAVVEAGDGGGVRAPLAAPSRDEDSSLDRLERGVAEIGSARTEGDAASRVGALYGETAPLEIDIPEAELKKLTPQQREDARKVAGVISGRSFLYKSFPMELPGTVFGPEQDRVIAVADLFREPTSDEVERIGTSEGGQGPRLTDEQMSQVRADAAFSVPSQDHPGQSHVWKLSRLLQKGRAAISDSFQDHMASSFEQLTMELPASLAADRPFSAWRGLLEVGRGLAGAADLMVGVPQRHPARSEDGIRSEVEAARVEFITGQARSMMEAGNPFKFDLRLYDRELMAKAAPVLSAVEEAVERSWKEGFEERARVVEAQLRKAGVAEAGLPQGVADRLADMRNQALYDAVLKSAALESVGPGLGALVVDRLKARVAVSRAESEFLEGLATVARQTEAAYKKEHPILSRVEAVRQEQVAQAVRKEYRETVWPFYLAQGEALVAQGLKQEGYLLGNSVGFYQSQAPAIRRALEGELAPDRIFEHRRLIWNPKRWKITPRRYGDRTYYEATKYSTRVVSSASPLWRLRNLFWRAAVWTSNAARWLIADNLWNGKVGVRSLFGAKPFAYRWFVDEDGRLVLDQDHKRQTLVSRIGSLWRSRREILADFRSSREYGFLGRDIRRIGLFFSADLGRGVVAPLAVLVGQPVLTLVNTAASAALIATAWLWAPGSALAGHAFNAGVFDFDSPRRARRWRGLAGRFFPLAREVIGRAGVLGVGQILAGFAAMIVHGAAGVLHAAAGVIRTGSREAWDALMRGVIRWRGRVPPRDHRFFIRRVSGPGLSSEYFFQVPSDLALVALQAHLESSALAAYESETQDRVRAPRRAYEAVMEAMGAVTGSSEFDEKSPSFGPIAAAEKTLMERLEELVAPRSEFYGRLLAVPGGGRIKLASSEHETVLKKSVVLTERFYAAFFKEQGWSAARVRAFWKSKGLAAGSWEALARSHLSGALGAAFLVPLEETDSTLRIEVQAPGLRDYAAGLEAAVLPEHLANVVLTDSRPGEASVVSARVPAASAAMASDPAVIKPDDVRDAAGMVLGGGVE